VGIWSVRYPLGSSLIERLYFTQLHKHTLCCFRIEESHPAGRPWSHAALDQLYAGLLEVPDACLQVIDFEAEVV